MENKDHFKSWQKIEAQYYMQVVNRLPVVLVMGKGTLVWDNNSNKYLDFTAGWAVLNLGHSHPVVTNAIQEQSKKIMQMTNLYYTIPQLGLAKLLVDNSCYDRIFFANSGTEANEGACKLARKWGREMLNGAYEIITANNSFHGRTMAMMAATGQKHYQEEWEPLMPGFINLDYNDFDQFESHVKDQTGEGKQLKTCGVLLEVVQGEGGINVPDQKYLLAVQNWCQKNNVLFMVDEVQTGMGRLGTLFGYQKFGLDPDVMVLGKALGAGVPLGAFLCKERFSVLSPGDHGSTFGGNALTTAAGWASAKYIIETDLPAEAAKTGKYLSSMLEVIKERHDIESVRGFGLLIGLELKKNKAQAVIENCLSKGLLLNAVRPNVIRFFPPLNVSEGEVNQAVEILEEALIEEKI